MDTPGLFVLFARVVESGSFSAAARDRHQSPSAVSKQIAHLEDRVGVRLLNRSKTGVSLTDDGRVFYERCAEISRNIDAAEDLVRSFSDHPSGLLRIGATVAFGKAQVLPALPDYLDRHPDVRVALELSDRAMDLNEAPIDIAIQFTEQIESQTVIARKLAHNSRVICASPGYLEKNGLPRSPRDLEDHDYLQLATVSRFNDWHFDELDGQRVRMRSRFEADDADAIYHATLAGLGIARLSTYLVGDDIAAGRLVRILPGYEDNDSDIYAVYSARRNLPPKVRAFIDHLLRRFSPVPPWESADAAALAAE